jgi:hypothetical protein
MLKAATVTNMALTNSRSNGRRARIGGAGREARGVIRASNRMGLLARAKVAEGYHDTINIYYAIALRARREVYLWKR